MSGQKTRPAAARQNLVSEDSDSSDECPVDYKDYIKIPYEEPCIHSWVGIRIDIASKSSRGRQTSKSVFRIGKVCTEPRIIF